MPSNRQPRRSARAATRPRAAAICASIAIVALLAVLGPGAFAQAPARPSGYQIIVNPANPILVVDETFVAQALLKKIHRWPDGDTIQPVDLDQNSPVRSRLTNDVLNRSVQAVRLYWQQMIFSGRDLPPPEMRSDEDVVEYVLRRRGGLGYVSTGTNLHGAKVLTVR